MRVSLGIYCHHGIACGDGSVIHFGRGIFDLENAIVEKVTLAEFCQGKPIEVYQSDATFEAHKILARAKSRLGETGYDLAENNCEHFACWCRTGEHESRQVQVAETLFRQSAAVAGKPFLRRWISKKVSQRVKFAGLCLSRSAMLAATAADTVQATAELVATRAGKTQAQTERIGHRVGFVSSAALGLALGGPVSAATGVGIWAFGQVIASQTLASGKRAMSQVLGSEVTGS
ncbi:MAG: hypothetical protein ACI87E_004067 [Mariniblastus sp.]